MKFRGRRWVLIKGDCMNIVNKKIEDLKPYKNNPRKHPEKSVEFVANSIKEFGFKVPILIDKNNEIIAGHTRLLASQKLGLEKVPCIVVDDLTPEQVKAFRIADNKVSEFSEWDDELLSVEFEELKELDFDIGLTGFGADELSDIFGEEETEVAEDNYEVVLPEEPKAKLGDIYQLGRHRLMCGDSTVKEDVFKLMDGKKADMIFTDPPWNVNYGAVGHPSWKQRTILNDSMSTEDFKDFMLHAFARINECSKEGAMTYVFMSAQEWGNMMLAMATNNFHWSSTIIWNKDTLVLSRKDYHTKYEPIWYGWKEGEARLCPLKDRKQTDVWDFERPKRSDEHPTMKPVSLIVKAISNSSKKKDIIIDFFGGSGSTLIASEQTERTCYMMELDPKYCDVIIDRWETFTGEKAVKIER